MDNLVRTKCDTGSIELTYKVTTSGYKIVRMVVDFDADIDITREELTEENLLNFLKQLHSNCHPAEKQ